MFGSFLQPISFALMSQVGREPRWMLLSEPAVPQFVGKSIEPVGRRVKVRLGRGLLLRHTMDAASIFIDSIHV
jgi:hypothetical protein